MDEKTIYNNILLFFVSLIADFYKKSTTKELPNILTVFNTRSFAASKDASSSSTPASLASMISDTKLSDCMKRAVEFLKGFIKKMETNDSGIPVTGGSVEAWRMQNIAIDIISHNIKLHRISEFEVQEITAKIGKGSIGIKAKWPEPYLSQSYILNGMIDGKKAKGSGEFKIFVTNFALNVQVQFSDKGEMLEIIDFKIRADFDDARIQVTGLEVEGSGNAEEIMNTAIQRDKQKFKEMLLTNTLVLSEQTQVVLNAKLKEMPKKTIVDALNQWCNK